MNKLLVLVICFVSIAYGHDDDDRWGRDRGNRIGVSIKIREDDRDDRHGGKHDGGYEDEYYWHEEKHKQHKKPKIETIPLPDGVPVGILDSPYYDVVSKSLYFVDLFGVNVYRYSEELKKIFYFSIKGLPAPSFFIPANGTNDTFYLGVSQSIYTVQWDGVSTTAFIIGFGASVEKCSDHSTNHGIAGSSGELYFGTLNPILCGSPAEQGLYRLTCDGKVVQLPGLYKTSNSLAFDYKLNILYHLDGCTQTLRAFKIDPVTLNFTEPKIIIKTFHLPSSIAPVGLSVRTDGFLVVGTYKGGKLYLINPFKCKIIGKLKLPTKYLSSNAYGGKHLNKLYVLTGKYDVDIVSGKPTNNTVKPPAGSILVVHDVGKGIEVKKPILECDD